jgi:cytochrome c oxidase subunit 3
MTTDATPAIADGGTAGAATSGARPEDGHHAQGEGAFLRHHFDTPSQQFESAKLGMWLFLAQEILFFSGLFVAYGIYRNWYPQVFSLGSHLLDWRLGALNTVVLLFSSLTVALAVRSAQLGKRVQVRWYLVVTILCALGFMVVKFIEYEHKFHVGFGPGIWFAPTSHGVEEIEHALEKAHHLELSGVPFHLRSFLGIYFMMTAVHGLHVLVGIGILLWILVRNERGEFGPKYFTPVELSALYWHLVDLIWIYLFPLLYLID